MAVTPTPNNTIGQSDGSIILYTWVLTTANPAGVAIQLPEYADKTVSIFETGDAAGGSTCAVEGSNNNTDFVLLSRTDGVTTGLTFVVAAPGFVKGVVENPLYVRPNLTTPGAAASVTVRLLVRRANALRQ